MGFGAFEVSGFRFKLSGKPQTYFKARPRVKLHRAVPRGPVSGALKRDGMLRLGLSLQSFRV